MVFRSPPETVRAKIRLVQKYAINKKPSFYPIITKLGQKDLFRTQELLISLRLGKNCGFFLLKAYFWDVSFLLEWFMDDPKYSAQFRLLKGRFAIENEHNYRYLLLNIMIIFDQKST